MLNAVLRTQNVRKPLIAGVHTGTIFQQAYICRKNQLSAFLFQTRKYILYILQDEKQGIARL